MEMIVAWVGGAAVVVGGLAVIWRKGLRPIFHGIGRLHHGVQEIVEAAPPLRELAEAAPVLLDIAGDFKPNAGNSLGDRMARIDDTLAETKTTVEQIELKAEVAHTEQLDILTRLDCQDERGAEDRESLTRIEAGQDSAELRRIEEIPAARRTPDEQAKLDEA